MIPDILHPVILHYACGSGDLGCTAPTGSTGQFLSTPLGGALGAVMSALGVLIVIIAIIKGVGDALGKGGLAKSLKMVIGALILGSLLIYPAMIGDLISLFASLIKDAIDSISQLAGSGSSNTSNTVNTVTNVTS
jgi:hypothetical protein